MGEVPPGRHVAAKGKVAVRPELVDGQAPQVRVAHGDESEQIVDLALEATGGKGAQRERRKARLIRRNRHQRGDPGAPTGRSEDVRQREISRTLARVARADELHVEPERGDAVGNHRDDFA